MPNLFVQSERRGLGLVLLPAATFSPQLRRGKRSVPHSIRHLPRSQEEHPSSSHRQNEEGRQSQSYIGYFQSQLAKVLNCGGDIYAFTFISGLQVSHPLYKHLLKHNDTWMSEVLYGAQPYIQFEEAMKSFANYSAKRGDDGEKSKLQYEAIIRVRKSNQGQPAYKKQAFSVLSSNPLRAFRTEHFTPLRLPINEVFNAIKTNCGSGAKSQSNICSLQSRGILLLSRQQGTQDYLLQKPPMVP